MYQAWPWAGTPAATASPTAAGYVQPAAAGQVGGTQWPAGYNQYAAMTPEMQQQWAAAWASQAQYAYGGAVPVAGQAPNTAVPYPAAFPESQAAAADSNNAQSASEQPKNPTTELSPKDSAELDKLKQLKEQAEQWKTLQQPTTAAAPWNYTTAAAGVSVSAPTVTTSGETLNTAGGAAANANASQPNQAQLDQEEEEFERQFKDWEKQFESWKEQNIGHPDKEAFAQYEKQWQEWRATLLQKKEQMQKAKAERAAAAAATSQAPATTTSAAAVDPNAALYYQQAQYMYMQPYMYPGGMPAVPPAAGAPPTQQFPYGAPEGYGQPPASAQEMQQPNSNRPNAKDMNNFEQDQYGQGGEQFPAQSEYQNFDEYGNMYPPDMDQEQYQRDMNFGRGRGARGRGARGRGRGRGGRGGRWSDPSEGGEGMPRDMRTGLLDNPGEFPPGEFPPGGSGEFRGGPEEFPPRDFHDGPGNFGRGPGPLRDFPMDSPGKFRDGPGDFNAGPPDNQGPPFDYPPENFGPGEMDYPQEEGGPPRQRRNFPNEERFPFRDGPSGKTPLLSHDGSSPSLLPPRSSNQSMMNEGPPPQPSNRYPPDDFDEEFPEPPFDDHFPPRGEFEGGYPPPMGEFGGRPPFREDYPPPSFENRYPPGRGGRFPPRRGRFPPHGDFDRFGGPSNFPPGEGPPFGPPDDRFPFPGEGPRMPGRGSRHFGPGNRFPDDPFFREGGPGPMRFKSKDYTHRSAEDFDPHYEFENDFQEDVVQFRDNFTTELSVISSSEPVIFSQVNVETFDYGHGLEPMITTTTVGRAKDPEVQPPVKVFNYAHRGGIEDPDFPEREFQERDRLPPFPGDRIRDREYDKPRDRSKDIGGRDSRDFGGRDSRDFRGRDFGDRDSKDFGGRDSRDFAGRESRDFGGRESRDFGGRESRDFGGRESRDFGGRDSREPFGGEPGGRDSREHGGRNLRDSRDHGGRDFKPPGGRDSRDPGRDLDYRDSKRGRERHREEGDSRDKRPRWDSKEETERNGSRDKPDKKESLDTKGSDTAASFKSQNNVFKSEDTTLIDDLLSAPKRETRPKQMVIILRGLPGSGKTYVAKLIKDKEIENGGSAPRILSLDDYFMVEVEVNDIDPDTGKKVKRKEFKFEFESEMEETYRSSLFKSFKKTIDDRFFPFIIVDAIHNKSKHYEQYWSYAKQRGFQAYIAEMDCKDPSVCFKRNTHNRSLEDITKLLQSWEPKPKHFMDLDVRSLLQDVAITEVEMEVEPNTKKDEEELDLDSASNDADEASVHVPSRWEKLEATEEKLDQLDGLRVKKSSSMEDYLQLPDDYEERKCEPGKKRVRWADLEERKEQDRLRAIGFVVGQTDWNKMTDPSHADRALTKTKFF